MKRLKKLWSKKRKRSSLLKDAQMMMVHLIKSLSTTRMRRIALNKTAMSSKANLVLIRSQKRK